MSVYRPDALALRRIYGWLAFACSLLTVWLAVTRQVTNGLITFNLFLSFLALWQTTRVEVKADPDIEG